jgi:hypothetical protein
MDTIFPPTKLQIQSAALYGWLDKVIRTLHG